jgi:hypothetical protein
VTTVRSARLYGGAIPASGSYESIYQAPAGAIVLVKSQSLVQFTGSGQLFYLVTADLSGSVKSVLTPLVSLATSVSQITATWAVLEDQDQIMAYMAAGTAADSLIGLWGAILTS